MAVAVSCLGAVKRFERLKCRYSTLTALVFPGWPPVRQASLLVALDSELNCVHLQPSIDFTFLILHITDKDDLEIIKKNVPS